MDDAPEYFGSIGTTGICRRLQDNKVIHTSPSWDVSFINLFTLYRNCNYEVDKIVDDIFLLSTHLDDYFTYKKCPVLENHKIVFYLPNYDSVSNLYTQFKNESSCPECFFSEKMKMSLDVINIFRKALKERDVFRDVIRSLDSRAEIIVVEAGDDKLAPHKWILENYNTVLKLGDSRDILKHILINSIPLDTHLMFDLKCNLLQSFNGDVVTLREISRKIMGDNIPFTKMTHLLFGDKVLLSKMVTNKENLHLKRLAKTERWITKTSSEIICSVSNHYPDLIKFLIDLNLRSTAI